MTIVGPFEATVSDYQGEATILQFCGEEFKVADNVGGMPLLEFAAAAKSGLDSSELDGLAAMFAMIRDTLAEGEWDRFRDVAKKHKAPVSQLMEVCTSIYAALSNRPTQTASDSPSGLSNTKTSPSSDLEPTQSSEISTELASKKPANKKVKTTG